eukprot:Rhum_TRINITY_DN14837_c5_g12::Rhum_TRINITY_DN14837_c5_g12_i1::g.120323::m.120323
MLRRIVPGLLVTCLAPAHASQVMCSTYGCPTGFQDKAAKATIPCEGLPPVCSDATCCDAEVLCATHTCSPGRQDKESKAMIKCVGMPPVCDDATCCDAE